MFMRVMVNVEYQSNNSSLGEVERRDVVLVGSSQMYTTVMQHSIPHGGREN